MSRKTDKRRKINKALERHVEQYDEKLGSVIINDFMQISKTLERLKEVDPHAFHAMFALVEENSDLKAQLQERGQRIAKLQKGQTQPK
ncbi:hypothetical protein [Azospirillum sp. B4]|uniref:hypothetical protein n=1 Tax=Azospirillum sp. B4 TaxID=95605 RepID=UPI0011DDC4C9|nr:hypothetical protein [Azospirillum sp. B4]